MATYVKTGVAVVGSNQPTEPPPPPPPPGSGWILDDPTYSILDNTTRLG